MSGEINGSPGSIYSAPTSGFYSHLLFGLTENRNRVPIFCRLFRAAPFLPLGKPYNRHRPLSGIE